MQVIEEFIKSKTDFLADCEDRIVVTKSFIALLDGAGSRTGQRYENNKTSGQMAINCLQQGIEQLRPDVNASDAIAFLSENIERKTQQLDLTEFFAKNPSERFIASGVIYSDARRELWFVGDCQALFGDSHFQPQNPLDEIKVLTRGAILQDDLLHAEDPVARLAQIRQDDYTAGIILPLVKAQSSFENTDHPLYGHGVFNGTPIPDCHVHIRHVPENIREICLASDGYGRISPSLAETEAHLAHLLTIDPLCYRENPQMKGLKPGHASYDDRAYIRFSI